MQFTFRVKRKAAYERGTIVFGKILSGTIDKDKDVLVSVGKNEYKAHIDSIIDKPDGGYVQSCSKGNNVSLYLSGIEEQLIKPRITVVRNYSVEKYNGLIHNNYWINVVRSCGQQVVFSFNENRTV